MSLKLIHCCTMLSKACHFDVHIISLCVTFHNKTGCQTEWLHIKTILTDCPFKMVLSAKLTVISEAEEVILTKNHLVFPPTYQIS